MGSVHIAGGGEVQDAREWAVGKVERGGDVYDRRGNRIGSVSGTNVYDDDQDRVGHVDAETYTTWVTGISDAHKAGAALLLLLLSPLR